MQAFDMWLRYLVFCLALSGILSNSTSSRKAVNISSENYKDILVRDKFCLILFYSSWDEDCKKKIDLVDKLSEDFSSRDDLVFAKVDTYTDLKIGGKFRLDSFCSIRYTVKGSVVPESYKEPITRDHLIRFIEINSRIVLRSETFTRPVIHLDDLNFDRIVKDEQRDVLVYFHTIWCNKCKDLYKVVTRVGQNFQNEPNCVVADIDGEKSFNTVSRNEVGVYPSFRFYPRNDKDGVVVLPGKYDENWSEYNLTRLLNLRCQTKRTADGFLDKTAGRYDELDTLARYFMRNSHKREKAIREAVETIHKMPPYKKSKADYYVKVMERIMKDTEDFLAKEIIRIENILQTSIHWDKKDDLTRKRNVLRHFQMNKRDEL